MNLETSIIMTEREVVKYFNKFYVVPLVCMDIKSFNIQDTLEVDNQR